MVAGGDPWSASQLRRRARAEAAARGEPWPEWAAPRASAFRRPRAEPAADATPAVSAEIPAALRKWRERTPGASIQISRSGVVLTYRAERRFASIAEAVEAIGA